MPNMLVKDISRELLNEVNYAAGKVGLKQGEFVIEVLAKAVGSKETERLVRKGKTQATGQKPDGVDGGVPSVSLGGNGPNTGQEGGVPGAAEKSTAPTRSHDPKTCRIYGCGMCKVLKGGS